AVVFATAESALKEARNADRHNKRASALGPLHGVPFTAKDIFNTAGLPTTAGLRMLRTNIPDHDATVVARMRRAGAILIGKTNCPPGGVGSDSWNPLHGGTRNPYDVNRSPGGSSSGEAAIIAAGGSPLGIGSDSGGSIRMPASYCAVAAAVRAAAKALSAAGCVVTEERLPGLSEAEQVTLGYWGRKHMSHERLYRRWDAFRTSVLTFMSTFDLVLSPVAPDVAPLYR